MLRSINQVSYEAGLASATRIGEFAVIVALHLDQAVVGRVVNLHDHDQCRYVTPLSSPFYNLPIAVALYGAGLFCVGAFSWQDCTDLMALKQAKDA